MKTLGVTALLVTASLALAQNEGESTDKSNKSVGVESAFDASREQAAFEDAAPSGIRVEAAQTNKPQPQRGGTSIDLAPKQQSLYVSDRARIKSVVGFDPDIVSVGPIDQNTLALTGRAVGHTEAIITGENGNRQTIAINVTRSTELRKVMSRLYPEVDLELVELQGSVLVRGEAPDKKVSEQIISICEQFYPSVLNHLSIKGTQEPRSDSVSIPHRHNVLDIPTDERIHGELREAMKSGRRFVVLRDNKPVAYCKLYRLTEDPGTGRFFASVMVDQKLIPELVRDKASLGIGIAEANPPESISEQLDELHQDVKRLIQLLEKRQKDASVEFKPNVFQEFRRS